jgi:hypothetical protein
VSRCGLDFTIQMLNTEYPLILKLAFRHLPSPIILCQVHVRLETEFWRNWGHRKNSINGLTFCKTFDLIIRVSVVLYILISGMAPFMCLNQFCVYWDVNNFHVNTTKASYTEMSQLPGLQCSLNMCPCFLLALRVKYFECFLKGYELKWFKQLCYGIWNGFY